ncbi:MAG: glycosyltransferase [Clostridia bacterium]|nr:glycosyltransferase [Clostridia bacterium]
MRVLILTITTGQGHNQVAKNLSTHLSRQGMQVLSMDVLEYISPALKGLVSQGYLMSTKRLPKVYGKAYRMAEKRDNDNKFIRITGSIMAEKLARFVNDYIPDVIICTHVFAAMLIESVDKKIKNPVKTVGIVTDFTIHPYWEETELDYYITATELLSNQALKKGIPKDRILPIGIPISPIFASRLDKSDARHMLKIDDIRTVLVMGGSMGYGKLGKMIKQIDKSDLNFQIISVCGHNNKLRKEIDNLKLKHPIYNYGFSDKVDLFMDASDCIITKPGGLTTSEALAKGLPMIMANPIPGQEDRNVEFLLNNGVAFKVSTTFPVDEALYQMFTNTERIEGLRPMFKMLGRGDATQKFTEFMLKLEKELEK